MTTAAPGETPSMEEARRRWSGATAVVTGAGSGLGAAFAEVAAGLGMSVVVADVDAGRAGAVARRLASSGADVRDAVVDVRHFDEVEALAADVDTGGRPLGLVVNNAGVEHVGLLWEEPPESWHRVLDVNLHGVYHGVRAFVPRMVAAGGGTMLNVASVGAFTAGAHHGAYEVTKHGVLVLSEALAEGLALAGAPVQVSVALPGPVATRIYEDANADPAPAGPTVERVEAMRRLLAGDGMDPVAAARLMLARVAAGAFAVTTHPDMLRPLAARRAERLRDLAGISPSAPDPGTS